MIGISRNAKIRLQLTLAVTYAVPACVFFVGTVLAAENSMPQPTEPLPNPPGVAILEAPTGGIRVLRAPGIEAVSVARAADALGEPINFVHTRAFRSASRQLAIEGRLPGMMPVAFRSITSGFGTRYHPLLGVQRAHNGLDLAAPVGTPVVAVSEGTVNLADWSGGYGLLVEIDHGGGLQTRYGHMSRLNVSPGDHVRVGQVIGFVGSTGLSTGPHVHYEVRFNGQAVNPMPGGHRRCSKCLRGALLIQENAETGGEDLLNAD